MTPHERDTWFDNMRDVLETSYLSRVEPWSQSGMSGPEDRWTALRKPVANCVDRSGSFLDIGCANGYLLECCVRWVAERGLRIEPYGLDISSKLAELTKERLPQFADRVFVGNSFYWAPPLRFDYVRTELVYVPSECEKAYLEHLFEHYLGTQGRLLIANYVEDHPHPEIGCLSGSHPTDHILDRLAELGFEADRYEDGFDTVKNRRVRIAVLTKQ